MSHRLLKRLKLKGGDLELMLFTASERTFSSEIDIFFYCESVEVKNPTITSLVPLFWFTIRHEEVYPLLLLHHLCKYQYGGKTNNAIKLSWKEFCSCGSSGLPGVHKPHFENHGLTVFYCVSPLLKELVPLQWLLCCCVNHFHFLFLCGFTWSELSMSVCWRKFIRVESKRQSDKLYLKELGKVWRRCH